MSVYPPAHVAVPLGGYRTKPLSNGIRMAAHLVANAAVNVASRFAPVEWEYVYKSFNGREVEPESNRPGHHLAEAVEQHHARFGAKDVLDGKDVEKSVSKLCDKLRQLDYLQAWAMLIAIRWREEYDHETAKDGWWTLAYREHHESNTSHNGVGS